MVARQHYRWDFIGLSTDNKPTPTTSEKVVDGSTFYCSDNSKLYVWYNDQWYEKTVSGGGGGGGGGTSDFDQLSNRPKYNGVTMTSETDIPEVITYTAGDNVTITNGEISATDTTYSNFTGTDGTAAGAAGLVPAPATTDAGKFLKADGTWDAAGGSIAPVQTPGTSTTDVMSQNAVTSMVYADPATMQKVNIGGTIDSSSAYGTVAGYQAAIVAGADRAVAIGYRTSVSAPGSVAIGTGAGAANTGEVNIGSLGSTAYGYNNSNYRLISGVYDGQSAHDAATYGQVISYAAINGAGAPTTATEGRYIGQLYYDTTNEAMYFLKTIDTTTTPATYTWEAVGGGSSITPVQTPGTSTTDVMSQNAVTSMVFADPATQYKIKIGDGTSTSEGANAVEIGHNAGATATSTVAVGNNAQATSSFSVALGVNSSVAQQGSVAIGPSASASGRSAVAVGQGSSATVQGQFDIGTQNNAGYNSSNYRLLTSLYDGQSAHDAATYGQVISYAAINGAEAPTTATEGRYVGQLYYDTTNEAMYFLKTIDTTTTPATYTWEALGGGGSVTPVQTTGDSTTDVMSQNAVTSMVFADPATQEKIKIGAGTSTSEGNNAVEIGHNAEATAPQSVALGKSASVNTNNGGTALGAEAFVKGAGGIAIAGGWNSASVTAAGAIRIGGGGGEVSGQGAMSIGYFAPANNVQGKIEVGSTSTSYGYNSSNYRLLSGLYDGQSAHDAATVGQITPTTDSSSPTTATVGRVGQFYIDTSTGSVYMCVAADSVTPTYTWKLIAS